MANTYHQIHLHVVFAVKNRKAMIADAWKNQLFGVIGNLINQANCNTIIVNGMAMFIVS
jgi:REP element-mobilizing transposase RayT